VDGPCLSVAGAPIKYLSASSAFYRRPRLVPQAFECSRTGAIVGPAIVAELRRALEHTERRSAGWDGANPATVLSQGRASRAVADYIARELLPRIPESRSAFEGWVSRFHDVVVGMAAISARVCQIYCLGIDVLSEVLGLAAEELRNWASRIGSI